MTHKKQSQHTPKSQQREPISLAPLGFEEALSDLLKTGPHPKEDATKPSPQKKQRRGSKSTDTD